MVATLTPDPDEVAAAGDPFDLDGAGFDIRQTRIVHDGTTGAVFRPADDGTFTKTLTATSSTSQTIVVQQCVAGSWTPVATTVVTIGSVYTPPGTPFADMAGWDLVFADEMNYSRPRGTFMNGSPDGVKTAFTTDVGLGYFAFKPTWPDTSRHGYYGTHANIEVAGGIMDILCNVVGGYGRTATLTCRPVGGSATRGGILGARYHIEMRCDPLVGFKYVPLLWPDSSTNNDMLTNGEIDWPEGDMNDSPHGFLHYTNGANPSDQYVAIPSPDTVDMDDWHVFICEWKAGTSVKFFLDGVQIGVTQTTRIPNVPMHLNLQFETSTGGAPAPTAGTTGSAQIRRVAMWKEV